MDSKFEEVFMKKMGKTGFLLVAIAVLVLAGCPQEVEEYSGSVNLSSLRVGDVAARNLPTEPTPRDEWEQAGFNPLTMDIAHVVFPPEAFDAGELKGVKVQAGVTSGTEIWYVKAAGGLKPADDAEWTKDNTFDLKPNNSVYLQVTAADKKTQVYYRLQIHELSTLNSIKALVIGNKNARISDLDGALAPTGVTLGGVNLAFGTENLNARIEVTKEDNGAEVQFLRVETGTSLNIEDFSALDVYNFDDGDTVYVKVIPSDGGAPKYYGAVVTSRRISVANIGGINTPIPDAGLVSAEAAAAVATPVLITANSSQTTELRVTKRDAAIIDYAYVPAGDSLSGYVPLTEETEITYTDNSTLYLKVKAEGFKDLFYAFAVAVKSDNRNIESVSIGGRDAVSVGTGAVAINVGTTAELRGAATLSTSQASAGKTVVVTFEEAEAVVTGYAVLASGTTPTADSYGTGFETSPVNQLATAITTGQHLHLRVEAANGDVWYYRIVVTVQSNNADLTAITAGGISATSLGTPQTAPWNGTGNQGAVGLDPADMAAGNISVTSTNANSAVRTYAVTANATTQPATGDFTGTNNTATLVIAANNYIWVRSVSQDGEVTKYYKILVESKQKIATLDSATINSSAATLPTPAATWTAAAAQIHPFGSTAPGTVSFAATVTSGSSATVRYGISTSTAEPTWGAGGDFTTFNSGDYVGVEVTAENGVTKQYYKWRLSFGSNVATLEAAPSLYIAGVPIASLGNPGTSHTAASGTTSGAISLNSTQATAGKSVVVYVTDPDVSEVVMSTNNIGTSDTTAPTFAGAPFTKTGPNQWTGAITTTALNSNNRRFYIRVTAQDTVTQNFYRFITTYAANTAVPTAISIGGAAVAAAYRGTPAGSSDAPELVAGNHFTDTVDDPLAVSVTWNTGGTNTTSWAVTSTLAATPAWTSNGTGNTNSTTLPGVLPGNYIWVRSTNGNYRNIYVIKVGPPPFTVTVAGQIIQFADLFTVNATGNTSVGGTPTPMTKVFLSEAQMAAAVVSVTKAIPTDTVKVIKYLIPESAGTTINTTAQAALFGAASEGGGTFNLNAIGSERGLPVLQVQYNDSSYYNIVPRKTQDIPFATAAPAIDGDLDAVWASAPELTIDRVATDTSNLTNGIDRGKPAKIKVLWDNDALYYYARVYDSEITTAGADHLADCIEFFKYEGNWTPTTTGNWTGQYRINAAGTLTGSSTAANTTCSVKTLQEGSDVGYIIEAKVTWSASAADVAAWTNKEIGVEFQVAYSIGSTRNICMGWNNRFGGNYQQSANAGRFVLKRP
jgi:hypothetical protein